jgi:hypothetical protein
MIDPLLGPLLDNGGPTLTHALLPGSPAINIGDPTAVPGAGGVPLYDQRGEPFTRVFGGRIDIGAFESQTNALPGDYNFDGIGDAGDYAVWRKTLNSFTDLRADGNGNGVVDQADYDVWRANFGRTLLIDESDGMPATGVAIGETALVAFDSDLPSGDDDFPFDVMDSLRVRPTNSRAPATPRLTRARPIDAVIHQDTFLLEHMRCCCNNWSGNNITSSRPMSQGDVLHDDRRFDLLDGVFELLGQNENADTALLSI